MKLIFCLGFCLCVLLLVRIAGASDCPRCFRDMPPMEGRASEGRPATIDGRPAISVKIDGSWDTTPGSHQTVAGIWDGVNNALNRWNTAATPGGQASPYYYDLRQTDANAQITIIKDANLKGACAETTGPRGGPYTIHLPANADARTLEALIETITHELGHTMGLWHPIQGCPATIMNSNKPIYRNGKKILCSRTDRQITPADVQIAKNVVTDEVYRQGCNERWPYGPPTPPPPVPPIYEDPTPPPDRLPPAECHYYYDSQAEYTCSTIDGDTHCTFWGYSYYLVRTCN